ncbi:MAG: DUF6597 domain-containing transcriptional factor [Alloprevotella sp.]
MYSFDIIRPSAPLQPYVRHYWVLKCTDTGQEMRQRVLPWGCVQLAFHKGRQLFSQTLGKEQPRHFACGQETGYADLCYRGEVEMIAVALQPYAARLFFAQPPVLFKDDYVDLEDLEDNGLAELARKIEDTANTHHCIALLEQFLLRRLCGGDDYNCRRLAAAVRRIEAQPHLKAARLADVACLSVRQFSRIFSENVGLTPKDFSRIIKVQRAIYMFQYSRLRQANQVNPIALAGPKIEDFRAVNFAETAAACGFADQSHMIKEFKCLTGYTPKEYLAAGVPYSDYFNRP